jgi:hypothetical protein
MGTMAFLQKVVGYVLTLGLVVCLVVAWLVITPLLRSCVWFSDFYHQFLSKGGISKLRARIPK